MRLHIMGVGNSWKRSFFSDLQHERSKLIYDLMLTPKYLKRELPEM
jgi:hypothetical protein